MRRNLVGAIALVIVSVTVGWICGARSDGAPQEVSRTTMSVQHAPVPLTGPAGSKSPSVTVFDNGLVSIQANRVAPEWVLNELTRQGAPLPASAAVAGGLVAKTSDCDASDVQELDEVDEARLVHAVREGAENERIAALTQSLQSGVDLPPEVLREAFESGPLGNLRVLAFAAYVDAVSGDTEAVRAALTDGTYNDDEGVRAEAGARLAEFRQMEQVVAATPAQGTHVP